MPKKGYKQTQKMKDKISGDKNIEWKGDNAGIKAMHCWVVRTKGKASTHQCIDCDNQARDWSNVDHSCKRILEDYLPRCKRCHMIYDKKFNNSKIGRPKNGSINY